LRQQAAELLGYKSHSDWVLEVRPLSLPSLEHFEVMREELIEDVSFVKNSGQHEQDS
jgi:hypothetical protein